MHIRPRRFHVGHPVKLPSRSLLGARREIVMGDSNRLPRKLVAILYADVADYSRLTGEDEDATHRKLSEYLDLISSTVDQHRGRIMHTALRMQQWTHGRPRQLSRACFRTSTSQAQISCFWSSVRGPPAISLHCNVRPLYLSITMSCSCREARVQRRLSGLASQSGGCLRACSA